MSTLSIAPRPAPRPPDSQQAMLPDAARAHLGVLVTELYGISEALRGEGEAIGPRADVLSALALWVLRVRHDLAEMEIGRSQRPRDRE